MLRILASAFIVAMLLNALIVNGDICQLESGARGKCRGGFIRYYYNTETGDCESFIYGGCGGNDNQFE